MEELASVAISTLPRCKEGTLAHGVRKATSRAMSTPPLLEKFALIFHPRDKFLGFWVLFLARFLFLEKHIGLVTISTDEFFYLEIVFLLHI